MFTERHLLARIPSIIVENKRMLGLYEIFIGCGYLLGFFTIIYVSVDNCRRK